MIRKITHRSGQFNRAGGDRVLYIEIDTENLAASKRVWESGKIQILPEKDAVNSLTNVAAGYWKFMDEEPRPIFPIYYTHVRGFGDDTVFITAHSETKITLTNKSGEVCESSLFFSNTYLNQLTKEGIFKVISEKEALALIDKPDRYFVHKSGFTCGEVAVILYQNGTKLSLIEENGEAVPYPCEKACLKLIEDGRIFLFWNEISKSQYEEIVRKAKAKAKAKVKFRDVKENVTNFVDKGSGKAYKVTVTTVIEEV